MTLAFLALAGGTLALTLGLYRDLPSSWPSRARAWLLGFAGQSVVALAVFPTDLHAVGAVSSQSGAICDALSIGAFVVQMGALALLSLAFGSESRWRSYQPRSLAMTAAIIVAFGVLSLAFRSGRPGIGIVQRAFVAIGALWLLAAGVALRRRSAPEGRPGPAAARAER